MTLAPLRDALANVYRAFREPSIVDGREDVVIEISLEAGARFELWLLGNAPASLRHDPNFIQQNTQGDLPTAFRHVTLDGVRIRWPTKLMAVDFRGMKLKDPAPHR